MKWHDHSRDVPEGAHAFLGASTYSRWLDKNVDDVVNKYINYMQAQKNGIELHAIAKDLISHGIRLPKSKKTYNMYINDAIGFRLYPEIPLKYSENCFGTTDAIRYDEKTKLLRIHDLKTGSTPASLNQLMVYAALFCLEYCKELHVKPSEMTFELRLYQNDDIIVSNPDPEEIIHVIDEIISKDKAIASIKEGAI